MFFTPAIMSLLLGSWLTVGLILISSGFGWRILRFWDLSSGSERQLRLEKQTYLISTLMAYAFTYQLLALFLFIHIADRLHPHFVGAMCAAGTLQVNAWGYPALILMLVNFFLAGLWLLLNRVDHLGYDYPLIRVKYAFLILMAPLILGEKIILGRFFAGLQPEIITSCCGSLFSAAGSGLAAELLVGPARPILVFFTVILGLTIGLGFYSLRTGKWGSWFGLAATLALPASLAAFIAWFSVYYYELPTHHCPFCVLQAEYGYVGYFLYSALLLGGLLGAGVGVLLPFRHKASLQALLPDRLRRLTWGSLLCYAVFLLLLLYKVATSNLKMS